jgi:hypothetical protein
MFYTDKEVTKREDVEGGTFITYKEGENDKIVFLTPKAVKYSLTEEKKEQKDIELAQANAVQEDILTILREHDTSTRIAEFAMQQVGYTLQQTHYAQLAESLGIPRDGIDEQSNVINGMWHKVAKDLGCESEEANYQSVVANAKFSQFAKLKTK